MSSERHVGLAFQGGCFFAGAIATGVVEALVDRKAFDAYNINAFSGTSAGALVAAMCWAHKLRGNMQDLPQDLRRQWLHNANGLIPTEQWGIFWKLFDRWMSLNPFYFQMKESLSVPFMHREFEKWLMEYVDPQGCMEVLFKTYVEPSVTTAGAGWMEEAWRQYDAAADRPRLAVGTTEIHKGEVVTIDDADLLAALLDAFDTALGKGNVIGDPQAVEAARERAIKVAAEYMTQALMTSGSLDMINGTTTINDIEGLSNEELLHKGYYLDGAFSQNPPISPLTNFDVDGIWTVEAFPKFCKSDLDSFEKREDRREELLQNAPVEHQYQFINKVNLWLKTGRLRGVSEDPKECEAFAADIRRRWEDPNQQDKLRQAFKESVPHPERYTDEEILEKLTQPYKKVTTRTISLPADLQPLTDGARIVNSRSFLTDMITRGRQNTLRFLDEVVATA